MGTKKISELPASTSLYDGCCFPVVTNGETKKVTFETLEHQVYEDLPVANSEKAGGVKPIAKTSGMTQPVGIDETGKLFTQPSGGSASAPSGGNVTVSKDGSDYIITIGSSSGGNDSGNTDTGGSGNTDSGGGTTEPIDPTPTKTLSRITANYNGGGTVDVGTSLNDLKPHLIVKAIYSDSSQETVTNYTLSGTINAGSNTITVSYGGKTTTFEVVGAAAKTLSSITASYSGGAVNVGTDVNNLKSNLVVKAIYSDNTQETVMSGYTLSGTINEGSNTITVSYSGKTTTFTVVGKSASSGGTSKSVTHTKENTEESTGTVPALNNATFYAMTYDKVEVDGASSVTITTESNGVDYAYLEAYDSNNNKLSGVTVDGAESSISNRKTITKDGVTFSLPANASYVVLKRYYLQTSTLYPFQWNNYGVTYTWSSPSINSGGSTGGSGNTDSGSTGGSENTDSGGTSTYTQMQKYDAVVAQCMQDISSYDANTSSLSSALSNKKGNCCTLAEYMKIACDYLGIECEIIYGTSDVSSYNSHIWNRVKLDGTTYWSDLTSCIYMGNTSYAHTKNDLASFSNYKDYVYRLETDGSYKQLSACTLTATAGTVTTTCSPASMTATVVKNEYSKCYNTISNKFTQYV